MASSTDVRAALVAALQADLVGPFSGAADSTEELTIGPSRWYLTGFLAPKADRDTKDPTAEEELGVGADDEDENETAPEPEPKQKNNFPASMGMSVLLPEHGDEITATVSFAEYVREERDGGDQKKRVVWRRAPHPPRTVVLRLETAAIEEGKSLPDTVGIRVCGKLEPADAPGLEPGTRALSLFVVNERSAGEQGRQDEQFIFQVELALRFEPGFTPRPNRQGEGRGDPDDETSDLQYRTNREWAVGHGVAVGIPEAAGNETIRTTWMPQCEVKKVDTHDEPAVVTSMEELAVLPDGAALAQALRPLVEAYGTWIERQADVALDSEARRKTRRRLLHNARIKALHDDKPVTQGPLRTAEFKQLVSSKAEAPGDLPPTGATFFARSVAPKGGLPTGIGRLVVAAKLREVVAQIGFTRLEPVSADLQGEYDLGVRGARVDRCRRGQPGSGSCTATAIRAARGCRAGTRGRGAHTGSASRSASCNRRGR